METPKIRPIEPKRETRFFVSAEIGTRKVVQWVRVFDDKLMQTVVKPLVVTEPYALPGVQLRGTFPPTEAETAVPTRQVVRATLRKLSFNEVSQKAWNLPRRIRRKAARIATARIWSQRHERRTELGTTE